MFRKKIIPFVTAFAMAFSLAVVPVKAAVDPGTVITGIGTVVSLGQLAISSYELWRDLNPDADESEYTGFNPGGTFGAYEDAGGSRDEYFAAAYDTYVSDVETEYGTTVFHSFAGFPYKIEVSGDYIDFLSVSNDSIESNLTGAVSSLYYDLYFSVPTSGNYTLILPGLVCSCGGGNSHFDSAYRVYFYQIVEGTSTELCKYLGSGFSDKSGAIGLVSGYVYQLRYYIELVGSGYHKVTFNSAPRLSGDLIVEPPAVSTRPTSITGNYGIVGDDGSVTNIGTQTIVNEGDSTYYNPVTNTSYDLSGWTYDYSTRTYDLSTTEGDTITVEYGDETVNITEGDTVYNVYYLVEDDGSSGDDEDSSGSTGDEECDHTYTSETTKAATCLLSGKETFTCSECGDTYTKTIPATGHDWSVLQSVTSQYDETGALVTEGYTIYQCGTCGEQYKSTDGTAPPGGSSGSGGTIWEKIGTLFGTIADGVIGMIETALSTLLDGLISLATTISEKGQRVIELVLGFFEKIPDLFGAFPDFLGAVFPFIPDDILLIIEFGLAAVVFAAIIKFFKKG